MKTIVTHLSPDFDAVASIWLIKRYFPQWQNAQIVFVSSGSLWNEIAVDSDPDVIYVDTGLGKFDHHQTISHTCATKKVFNFLNNEGHIPSKYIDGVSRLVNLITQLDHFAEVTFPDASADRYDICLHQLVGTLKYVVGSDSRVVECMLPLLESAQALFVNKVRAESEIKNGYIFESKWGKSIIISTDNKEAMKLAQKMGYMLVVTKTIEKGYVRIKIPPFVKQDLDPLYSKIIKADPKAYWYFHVSKHMLLNDPTQKPDSIPSSLSLKQLVALIKEI